MKRVLFINGHLNVGGVEKSLVDVLRHFDYSKYYVDLLLLEELGDYIDEIPKEVNVRLVDLHNTYGSLVNSLLRCLKQRDWLCLKMRLIMLTQKLGISGSMRFIRNEMFGDNKYDIVIAFRPGICTELAANAVPAEKRITWWHHGEYNLYENQEYNYRIACKKMDSIVSVSESCAALLREHIPDISNKLTVIPNMIDKDAIINKSEKFNPYCSDGALYHLVSAGRLSEEKHMENVVISANYLIENGISNFKWYVLGDGVKLKELEQLAIDKGVDRYVEFVGNKPNPYPYIKHADLFVHPSYVESQGLVVLEAMTLGVPCVVTRSLGTCEFIEDGVNGILTEQSAESLAEKVLNYLQDTELQRIMHQRTYCPELFMPGTVQKSIERLLETK